MDIIGHSIDEFRYGVLSFYDAICDEILNDSQLVNLCNN